MANEAAGCVYGAAVVLSTELVVESEEFLEWDGVKWAAVGAMGELRFSFVASPVSDQLFNVAGWMATKGLDFSFSNSLSKFQMSKQWKK